MADAVVSLVITGGLETGTLIVTASVAPAEPAALLALRLVVKEPPAVGVPEITPVVGFTVNPFGRFVAPKLVVHCERVANHPAVKAYYAKHGVAG